MKKDTGIHILQLGELGKFLYYSKSQTIIPRKMSELGFEYKSL